MDQSKNTFSGMSSMNKHSRSRILGSAFATNSNIIQPVSSKTLPPLSLSPSRMSELNRSDDSENKRMKASHKEREYHMRAIKFDTSMLSPCFDHIYKSYMYSSPQTERTHHMSTLNSEIENSGQSMFSTITPVPQKPMKLQVLKPCHSLMLKHMSHYEAESDKKSGFQLMYDQYNVDEKNKRKEDELKKIEEQKKLDEEKRIAKIKNIIKTKNSLAELAQSKPQNKSDVNSISRNAKRSQSNANLTSDKPLSKNNKEPYERRWIVGVSVSPDGTVINSPGLLRMVNDVEKLKQRPKLFPDNEMRRFSVMGK